MPTNKHEVSKEVPFRGGGFTHKPILFVGPVVFVCIIALLKWGTSTGWISDLTLPRPSGVAQPLVDLYNSGLLFKHLLPSLTRLLMGSLMEGRCCCQAINRAV